MPTQRPADSLQRAGLGILSIFVEKRQDAPDLDGLRLLDPFRLDAETLYLATIAMFQFDGPRGPLWSDWSSQYKPYLLPLQARARKDCAWGSWTGVGFRGRLRATALSVMNFEIYYHY